jgi:15,16-dihydrobiliverdin:ferredoxin oxidoreductase
MRNVFLVVTAVIYATTHFSSVVAWTTSCQTTLPRRGCTGNNNNNNPLVDCWKEHAMSSGTSHMGRGSTCLWSTTSSMPLLGQDLHPHVDAAEAQHGMPWRTSIKNDDTLLYMPFWEWQMDFMKENLTNLKVHPCSDHAGTADFSYHSNHVKQAQIVNLCFSSDEYRKIRMTYYDAGDACQVFNSLWYPDPAHGDLPVLGIDLLSFHRKRFLTVVDFQPLHDEQESNHATTYTNVLNPIKDEYDTLKGRMSSKFYDETQFFSQEMLFARFENEEIVHNDLVPAFRQYVTAHVNILRDNSPIAKEVLSSINEETQGNFVLDRQAAYDTYSAERDPATGMFASMFGKEWADDFVYEFLFSMSKKPNQ